ncbi:hypothetical protein [Microbacterium marinum]|uniref:hypothetical protein n=1 Tax=Microbacterium marinum TaxID=421115 RepID=UPI00384E5D9D
MPNLLARVVNTASPMVASISRTILARPGTEHVFTRGDADAEGIAFEDRGHARRCGGADRFRALSRSAF